MEEFMEADRAAQAMATMMGMARRVGNGDAMLGDDSDDGDDGLHGRRDERRPGRHDAAP
jgi:hypothetical protein